MAKSKETKLILPSMLSYERKLETSDAFMFSGCWEGKRSDEWKKISITKRKNRSTQSAEGIDDKKKKEPNPVSSDSDDANLFDGHDTLKLSFSIRIVGNLGVPFGCNDPAFEKAIITKVDEFKGENFGVSELALRYAYNIANGRFLWRNRVGAEEAEIHIKISDEQEPLVFDTYDFSLKDFDKNKDSVDLLKVAKVFERGLLGDEESFELIKVNAFSKLGDKQHVFPSQEMNMNEKGKTLFQLDGCAAMHNVKIGNAIRTLDTWYNRYEDVKRPIAIEPYGSVTQKGEAYRINSSEGDLYSLLVKWVNDEAISDEQKSYVTACLIRGGVFSKGK